MPVIFSVWPAGTERFWSVIVEQVEVIIDGYDENVQPAGPWAGPLTEIPGFPPDELP